MPETLNAVLVGCGGITGAWLPAIKALDGVKIVGLVDVRREAAEGKAREYELGDITIGTDLAATLAATRPQIVFDCTIPDVHKSVALTALNHGCHILGEKPMSSSLADAKEMLAASQRAGKIAAIIQNYRHTADIRRIKHFLNTPPAIGPMTALHADFFIGAHFGGFRDVMDHVLLLDMSIHTFDAARFISGAKPVRVTCHEWNPAGSWYKHGASAVAIFEMDNGVVFTYRGSWCAEGLMTSWNSNWRIIGQRGSLLWTGDTITAQRATNDEGFMRATENLTVGDDPDPAASKGHESLIRDFVDCVRTGRTPATAYADNIHSLAMVFAAVESAEKKQPVDIIL